MLWVNRVLFGIITLNAVILIGYFYHSLTTF